MDDNGSLILPEKFRGELQSGVVLTKGQWHCLYVFPRSEFANITEPLRSPPFTAKRRRFSRVLFASAADQIPDESGGITVPEGLRGYANLDGACTVIGVNDRLEIWNPEAWDAYLSDQEDRFAAWPDEIPPGSQDDDQDDETEE